jgi:hypothetical protein
VHRALLRDLPANAAYRKTLRGGIWETLQALFRNAPGSVVATR